MLHLPPYSHRYDLLAKLACLGAAIAGIAPVSRGLGWVRRIAGIAPYIKAHELDFLAGTLTDLLAVFVALFVAWRFLYRPLLVPAATWLFLRFARDTRVSWLDSVALSPLFQFDKDATWFPVPEIRDMSEGIRLAYLYALAERTQRIALGAGAQPRYRYLPHEVPSTAASRPVSGIEHHPALTRRVARLSDRTAGLLMVGLGALFGYWGVLEPVLALARHARHTRYPHEATIAAPPVLVIGLLYLTLGRRASRLFALKAAQRPTQLGLVLLGVLVLAGFVLHGWLQVRTEVGGL
jgi:hypothetical protein